MIANLMQGIDAAGRLWCNVMHEDITWPIHGYYRCRRCHRKYPVPWENAPQSRESKERARELSPALATLTAMLSLMVILLLVPPALAGTVRQQVPLLAEDGILRAAQRELLVLPGYTVFDYLAAKQLDDGSLLLTGWVRNAELKSAADDAVRAVAGSARIVNRIEILPRSQRDERLRAAAYRELYGDPSMLPYAIRKLASIHIVVRNGVITLEGTVGSGLDRMQAESAMRNVTSAAVHNHLLALEDASLSTLSSIWRNATVTP